MIGALRQHAPVIVAGVLFVVAAWLFVLAPQRSRIKDARDTLDERTALRASQRSRLATRDGLDEAIQEFVDRTLGGDSETVDHRVRSRLNRIAEECGIAGPAVGTGAISARRSPARRAMSRRGPWAQLRDEPDFVEVEAWVSGDGTLEQALLLVHRVTSEPWVTVLTSVRLDPSENGETVGINVRLITLYLPGREPASIVEGEADLAGFEHYAAIAGRNPFRLPPPIEPEQVAVAAPPEAEKPPEQKPRFPYGKWTVSGVAQGPAGAEAWLRNQDSGETRVLVVGDEIDRLTLIAAEGEMARFADKKAEFLVRVGDTLKQRRGIDEGS